MQAALAMRPGPLTLGIMYTPTALQDVHARTHKSLTLLLDHLEGMPPDVLGRAVPGFGYPTLLEQVHHVIGAERYWVGVLKGRLLTDEREEDRASLDALRAFRERVGRDTAAYLDAATEDEVNTPRPMQTWGGREVDLVPARVVIRTQTHAFHHLGQITAMCRLLGSPVPAGFDFPLA